MPLGPGKEKGPQRVLSSRSLCLPEQKLGLTAQGSLLTWTLPNTLPQTEQHPLVISSCLWSGVQAGSSASGLTKAQLQAQLTTELLRSSLRLSAESTCSQLLEAALESWPRGPSVDPSARGSQLSGLQNRSDLREAPVSQLGQVRDNLPFDLFNTTG